MDTGRRKDVWRRLRIAFAREFERARVGAVAVRARDLRSEVRVARDRQLAQQRPEHAIECGRVVGFGVLTQSWLWRARVGRTAALGTGGQEYESQLC